MEGFAGVSVAPRLPPRTTTPDKTGRGISMSLNMSIKHQKELDKANSINVIRKLLGLGHDLPAYLEEALETLTTAIFTFRRNCKIKPGQTAYFLVTGEEWIAGVLKEWPNSQWQKLAQPIP